MSFCLSLSNTRLQGLIKLLPASSSLMPSWPKSGDQAQSQDGRRLHTLESKSTMCIFFKKKKFKWTIYLFMAALGLHCYVQAFSSCDKQGLHCSSNVWAFHCWHLCCWRARLSNLPSVVMVHWLCCPRACGIFLYQGSNRVPCIGRQILNLWTTREVQLYVSYKQIEHLSFNFALV